MIKNKQSSCHIEDQEITENWLRVKSGSICKRKSNDEHPVKFIRFFWIFSDQIPADDTLCADVQFKNGKRKIIDWDKYDLFDSDGFYIQ